MSDKDLVVEARELLSKVTPDWRMEQSHDTDICTIVVGHGRWKQFDHHLPDNARLIIRAPYLLSAFSDEVERLHRLIVHMHVHSGYRDNGYIQMTTEQKALYDAIWNCSVEELDREEQRISDGK